ncbi:alpha-N-arabinofuranosidase [Halomicrobium salinisoli]|uniref:alpha-N-arabinofuranosidase n=1 Tax=Halomicrobium salinisoli TaxID=2878391 RepID=UPI001CF093FC|nr:alpha-L-arabinofuranosidase C-terminal domain-containing protein [Halomicrobium salinisoli]
MTDARITVHAEAGIDRIEPELHGHFSEHLGRCIYDGIWHSQESDGDGFREDVVSLLDDLDMPVLRWPGGCFADDYHWEDGVGPREERPRRRNLFWAQDRDEVPEEPNAFGTHEFLDLCERVGAEPYLAANVGSGDPQEAADWVEYTCYDGDTELANRRRENGRDEAYEVRYWGVGNENWGCGGQMTPEQYAREYRQFATYIGAMSNQLLDYDLDLIACGFSEHEWNRRFMEALADANWVADFPLDHLTLHHYYGRTMSAVEAEREDYDQLLVEALELDDHVDRIAAAIDAVATTRDIGVIVDEWGAWHTEAVPEGGLEQPGTVIDALSAAAVLDVFNHHSDVMTMSNIAQTVNVLQCLVETAGDEAWARPTYRVFDLYAPHKGNEAVQTSVDTPTRDVEDDELPLVHASASVDDDGETYVTMTNLDCRGTHTVELDVEGAASEFTDVDAAVLFEGQAPDLTVDANNADEFAAEDLDVTVESDTLTVELEPSTVAALSLQ